MNWDQLMATLRARKVVAMGVFVLVALTALVASLMLPKQYTAEASLLVDTKGHDPVYGNLTTEQPLPQGFLATQADIITSERVALGVVDALKLDEEPAAQQQGPKAPAGPQALKQSIAAGLRKHLEVRPVRESGVLTIAFTATDPKVAADVANAFARVYIETAGSVKAEAARASASWFEARTRQQRAALEQAEAKLARYEEANGIVAADEKLDVESARLAELSTHLTTLEALRSDSTSRERSALDSASSSPDVMQSPLILALRADIVRAEAKLRDLGMQLGPNHPHYQQAQAELNELKLRLQAESKQIAGGVGSANSVNLQREAVARFAFEEEKKRLLMLKSKRAEASVLQKDVESAQRAYDLVAQRLSQTSLEGQNEQSNVSLLSEAQPPLEHSKPKVAVNTLLGAMVGALLGIALALALESIDGRVRSHDDFARQFGAQLVASVPLYVPAIRVPGPARRPGASGGSGPT